MNSGIFLCCTLVFQACVATPIIAQCTTCSQSQTNVTQQNATRLPIITAICPKKCSCNDYRDLKRINCVRSNFSEIPQDIPVDVGYLILGRNKITGIRSDDMADFHEMKSLYLDNNGLHYNSIDDHAFDSLTKLTYLNLNTNDQLTILPSVWFQKLVSLEILFVRFSSVRTLQSGIFQNCMNLSSIYLAGNQIATISAGVFTNLPLLNILDLSQNNINDLPNGMFLGSSNISKVISVFLLHENQITKISEQVGIQNTKFSRFNFAYNPFSCDCKLVWFLNWIKQTDKILVFLNHATCKNKNGTSLVNFDIDSLICEEYNHTITIVISTCCTLIFLAVVAAVIYVFRWDLRYWNQRRLLQKQHKRIQNEDAIPLDDLQFRYDTFVSYNSKDVDWILKSALPTLEGPEFNFRLCVDFRDFVVGGAIADNISDAIKYSRKMLIVVTKNFAKSEWCYFEMEMAKTCMFENHEDIIVVVILEHVASRNMPTLLQKILRKKTYIEWTENPDGQKVFWARLAAALNTPNAHHDN